MKVVIIGAGGHAKVVADIVLRSPSVTLAGFVDDNVPTGTKVLSGRVLGPVEVLEQLVETDMITAAIVGVGDNAQRQRLVEQVTYRTPTLTWINAIHSSVVIGDDVTIGDGVALLAGAVVQPGARVGNHTILNTRAALDHDSTLGDFASLGPGAMTGGTSSVGARSFVGMGGVVLHGRRVGDDTVVGAGAVVIEDLPDGVVAHGIPARVVRTRVANEPYL